MTSKAGGSIDRDDLRALLDERFRNEHEPDDDDVDSIIRLIEPVAGVTLTPEEAARVGQWHTYAVRYMTQADDALAARLEAAQ